jgi:hypothetical protein
VTAAGNVQYVPVPIVTMPDQRRAPHAPQVNLPRPPQPTGPPPYRGQPYQVAPGDDVNAFTDPGPRMPDSLTSNGFGPINQEMPMPMPPRQPMPIPPQMPYLPPPQAYVPPPVVTPPPPPQVVAAPVALALVALRDALLPSEREMAANQLARCDWRSNGPVVQALVSTAQEDPAPSVRAASVRALVKMGVNTVPVVSALQSMKRDCDPRVQQEVEQALTTLASGLANAQMQGVQPAAATDPVPTPP